MRAIYLLSGSISHYWYLYYVIHVFKDDGKHFFVTLVLRIDRLENITPLSSSQKFFLQFLFVLATPVNTIGLVIERVLLHFQKFHRRRKTCFPRYEVITNSANKTEIIFKIAVLSLIFFFHIYERRSKLSDSLKVSFSAKNIMEWRPILIRPERNCQ